MIFDIAAAVGLWKFKRWGMTLFIFIALSQVFAYLGFRKIFGNQLSLVAFHFITLGIFSWLNRRHSPSLPEET